MYSRVVYSGVSHLEDGGRAISWGNGVSHLKDHLPISVEAEVFIMWGGEQNKELKGRACKLPFVQLSTALSDKVTDDMVCLILL